MSFFMVLGASADTVTNVVADLGTVVVEGSALSKYRPERVTGGTFTGEPPEKLPVVVATLTEDFIRERNPTDMNDLLRWVPGIETGGTSLLVCRSPRPRRSSSQRQNFNDPGRQTDSIASAAVRAAPRKMPFSCPQIRMRREL